MVNRVKYLIEMECEVEGGVDKLREVSQAACDGVDVNTTDIEGVENVTVNLVKAVKLVEEEIDLDEEEPVGQQHP